MPSATRERILDSTAELFRRQGYVGTGMKQIAADASAPFGSVYHFFPGGKEELGAQVIRTSGRAYMGLFGAIVVEASDPLDAVHRFFAGAAETLRDTDYADACPIATVALEISSASEPLREACEEVFEEWIEGITEYLSRAGIPRPAAREVGLSILCLLEGAFIFSRAARSTTPLLTAGATAVQSVRLALARATGESEPPADL